jgi:hypothetical protein
MAAGERWCCAGEFNRHSRRKEGMGIGKGLGKYGAIYSFKMLFFAIFIFDILL